MWYLKTGSWELSFVQSAKLPSARGSVQLCGKRFNARRLRSTMASMLSSSEFTKDQKGKGTVILWFKNDLRVRDNATLRSASTGEFLVPVYVFDPRLFGEQSQQMWGFSKTGPLRTQFLVESVQNLRESLVKLNSNLVVRTGKPEDVIPELTLSLHSPESPVTVITSKESTYEEQVVEKRLRRKLSAIDSNGCPPPTLKFCWEGTMHHIDDLPFEPQMDTPPVFTQYRKMVESRSEVRPEISALKELKPFPGDVLVMGEMPAANDLTEEAMPAKDDRAVLKFVGGEDAALQRIENWMFKEDMLKSYKQLRNDSGYSQFSSKLSPWLSMGCVSPRTVYWNVQKYERNRVADENTYWLIFELITRDFFRWTAVKEGTRLFAWNGYASPSGRGAGKPDFWKKQSSASDEERLRRWIDGETGVPFVDAAMRELKATGYMSNRLRQNVASFLIHDLAFPDWRAGAEYFESVLLDHDPASNYANWLYIAGYGSDPRGGRQFNVIKQAKQYDPEARFTKQWCPELSRIPAELCHEVYKLSTADQEQYGLKIGSNYPGAIVKMRGTAPPSNDGNGNRNRNSDFKKRNRGRRGSEEW